MKSNNERKWFEDSIQDQKVKEYLKYILAYQKEQMTWYKSRKKTRRIFSEVLLTIAIILFAASLITPLLPGTIINNIDQINFGNYYAWGYIFLITTTIILLGDRLFGHSNSWIRFTLTYLQIDTVCSEFHGKWIEILPQLEDEAISDEARLAAIQLLQKFDTTLKNIVKIESENWKEVFTTQLKEFSQKADSKLKDTQKAITEFKETTQKNLTKYEKVHLKIEFKDIPKDCLVNSKIIFDADKVESKQLNTNDSTWVLKNIPVGEYMIEYTIGQKDHNQRKVNDILSIGGETKVKIITIIVNTAKNNG
ncbi:SLATT domain-containing protein [Urechidicola croceus]|uniref:SMODS and SLOG-associating 2TM effector domain-containing protein n=1 Tax=Urechidicola croceus TaxID=1850246 RepID=A0A1D8P849_9FLAO|nr:SLATT domain-containing protein [Urechidicola croceus]AOW20747.1 hypothetical protein LPB138_08690 [Urechidicola croceus]